MTSPAPADPHAPPSSRTAGRDVALVAVFAALLTVLALVPAVPVGSAGVPITLQSLGVLLAGLVLGPWRGVAAVAVYVALGLSGLPVFAGGVAGLGVLVGPTAGYVLAWLPATFVTGLGAALVLRRSRGRLPGLIAAGAVGGVAITYLGGWIGLQVNLGLGPGAAFVGGVLPYLPGDGLKLVVAAFVAASVHRAFPDVLARRTPGTLGAEAS
ncbi:biotin transporter BioY [Aquipuribacter sp. SD81]|uniref:biotin transporter BioY n=1 Tax=Aquipuribacter sp. SD81 TaxID=3127703 RepID=UPI003018A2F3